jgi:hypothetical protein
MLVCSVNNQLKIIWAKEVVAYFEVLAVMLRETLVSTADLRDNI